MHALREDILNQAAITYSQRGCTQHRADSHFSGSGISAISVCWGASHEESHVHCRDTTEGVPGMWTTQSVDAMVATLESLISSGEFQTALDASTSE